jgi:hypothetical protein
VFQCNIGGAWIQYILHKTSREGMTRFLQEYAFVTNVVDKGGQAEGLSYRAVAKCACYFLHDDGIPSTPSRFSRRIRY